MTRDEVLKLAKEAGFCVPVKDDRIEVVLRFAALIIQAEREAIAEEFEELGDFAGDKTMLASAVLVRSRP
jgi:hypothetical protein